MRSEAVWRRIFLLSLALSQVGSQCARPSGCQNGGRPIFSLTSNDSLVVERHIRTICDCPEHFYGPCCQRIRTCVYGELSPSQLTCNCEDERFSGLRCEQVRCANGGKPFEGHLPLEYRIQPCRCPEKFTGRFCDVAVIQHQQPDQQQQSWLDFERLIVITALPVLFLVFAFFWMLLRQRKLDFLHKSPWATGFLPAHNPNGPSLTQPSTVMVTYTFCPVHCANETLQHV